MRISALLAALIVLAASGCDTPTAVPGLPSASDDDDATDAWDDGPRDVFVHLFEWRWADIAVECEQVLGPAGIGGVQVSPPNEYRVIEGNPWWERYQPVSYTLVGRSGVATDFEDMVRRCAAAGVDVYVDAVLNHMAWANADEGFTAVGIGGTTFARYDFPGLYGDEHFHDCRRGIEDWNSRWEVQNCELATLPDLATEHPDVRAALSGYLEALVELGVAGFRIDAAKHIPAEDLAAILSGLPDETFVFQEVIQTWEGEVVQASEYFSMGRVTEFRYSAELARVFKEGQLAWLWEFGPAWGFLPSDNALVFVDNHDNQRGHSYGDPVIHEQAGLYRLANAFMLAWPYGRPKLMSSYAITNSDIGPPKDAAGAVLPVHRDDGGCAAPWQCEHRTPSTLGMVGFRNATAEAPTVERWWDNGNDQIAFARGGLGWIAINREELPTLERRFDTGLPAGTWCDVMTGGLDASGQACAGIEVVVDEQGFADVTVGPLDAVALHHRARPAARP